MKNLTLFVILSILLSVSCTAQTKKADAKPEQTETVMKEEPKKEALTEVIIETTLGNITIALYNETPLHRDNFIKLVSEKFYDGVLFHRIIQNFMIQTGDPDSKKAAKGQALGMGGPGYTIPAEILPQFPHKCGAVGAARNNNPAKASSGSQFYIVDNPDGAPHLNGGYTVFGEVIRGMDVVALIASQPKNQNAGDRPLEDIKIISAKKVE